MAAWTVSWLAPVSPSVPTQYPQTKTLLAGVADRDTIVPCGTDRVCVAAVDAAPPLTETEHQDRWSSSFSVGSVEVDVLVEVGVDVE
jgi:hypothetical protein